MKIWVNGKEKEVEDNCPLERLLLEKGQGHPVVVIINGKKLLLKEYPTAILHAEDQISIVKILAGG